MGFLRCPRSLPTLSRSVQPAFRLPQLGPDSSTIHPSPQCFEIRCKPSTFTDGYGETISRESACRNTDESVVVTVTDACPCHKESNIVGNKRWCCGDQNHMDLSVWAFEKLASKVTYAFQREKQVAGCTLGGYVPWAPNHVRVAVAMT